MVEFVDKTLAFLTILSHVFLVFAIIFSFVKKDHPVKTFFKKNGLLFAWLISLSAVSISIFYSEFAGFEPCKLCWFQRIFMYPQAILLGLAYFRKDFGFTFYSLPLAFLGTIFSLYHNYIYYGGVTPLPCTAFGLGVSCARRYVFEFGYITIPLMSLTSFLLIILFLLGQKSYNNSIRN